MADEPIIATEPKKRVRKPAAKKDNRIIGARVITKEAAPEDAQRAWLEWYDKHTEKEKQLIADTINHIKYSTTGVGYRVMVHTIQAWQDQGVVHSGTAAKTRF